MKLHNLKPAAGSRGRKKRIGRGEGSGHGGTSTRGHKGAQARSGYSRKFPKFGFTNPDKVVYAAVNLATLQALSEKTGATVIDLEFLRQNGVIAKSEVVKILGNGDLTAKLEVSANAFSASAKAKIEAVGGTATTI